jgi:hypothetical protein
MQGLFFFCSQHRHECLLTPAHRVCLNSCTFVRFSFNQLIVQLGLWCHSEVYMSMLCELRVGTMYEA